MLKRLLRNTKFLSEIKKFYRANKVEIVDIVLFGSVVRGKEKPRDIDLMLVYKQKVNLDQSHALRKALRKLGFRVEITPVTYRGLFDPNFLAREAFLLEGYSLIQGKFISEGLGFGSFVVFRYELKGLTKSARMRFYYSLYGRKEGEKGILVELKSYKFSEGVIISPVEQSEKMKEFLNNWKIKYFEMPVLVPARIVGSKAFVKTVKL